MPRAIWKGAISFGLVHVPVALYPATQEQEIDFDWLDRRTMDPVGYKRVNKRTGREIGKDDVVKGVKQDDGDYVVLSDEEVREAYPKTTQTIGIEAFVQASELDFVYLERPYYLEPGGRGSEKVYALLREAMREAGVVGIGRLVMHTKEHLAALLPAGPALMLETIRWSSEIRPVDALDLPAAGKSAASLKADELKMARELIEGMTCPWDPSQYGDRFTEAIKALMARKRKAGKTAKVAPLEEAPAGLQGSNVIDLAELLKRSLGQRAPAQTGARPAARSRAKPAAKAGASAAKTPATKPTKRAAKTRTKTHSKTPSKTLTTRTAASTPARKRA